MIRKKERGVLERKVGVDHIVWVLAVDHVKIVVTI